MIARLTVLMTVLLAGSRVSGDGSLAASGMDGLESGFQSPPMIARPLVWWDWMNGNVTKEGILADLTDMKRAGFAGVQLFDVRQSVPPGPVRYGTDQWHEMVQYAIETAEDLGLEFYAMNSPGWSGSGGPWVTPDQSMKKLVWSETNVCGGNVEAELPMPPVQKGFYEDVAVLAVPRSSSGYRVRDWDQKTALSRASLNRSAAGFNTDDPRAVSPENVINLTESLSENAAVSCRLPDGEWSVLRFGYASTGAEIHPVVPEAKGLEVDKLDPEAVAFQFRQSMGRILKEAGPRAGTVFKGIVFDSFEGGFQNWTDEMPAEFERVNGYDLIPFLPVFAGRVIGSMAETEAVLYDFRCTVDRMISENYFGTMQRLAHQRNLVVYSESQGGYFNPFTCNRYVDIPMNEFWVGNYYGRMHLMKQAAASANLNGGSVVGAESFTAVPEDGRWQNTPQSLKSIGDCAFTCGINRFIFHTYMHQPYPYAPGFTMGRWGSHFGRLNSWWKFVPAWIDYLSRSQFLLQQGQTVHDLCFLQHDDLRYAVAADHLAVPFGYDCTICYPDYLADMACADGVTSSPDGIRFRLMVLPPNGSFMELNTLRNLRRLVQQGMTLSGNPPGAVPGLHDLKTGQQEFSQLVDELWGGLSSQTPVKKVGRGREMLESAIDRTVQRAGLSPDFAFAPAQDQKELRYIHRRTDAADIYFVANLTDRKMKGNASFRVSDRTPEIWDAVAGRTWDAPVFRSRLSATELPLRLDPHESVFVIFRRPPGRRWICSVVPDADEQFAGRLLSRNGGRYSVHESDGSSETVPVGPAGPQVDLSGGWEVRFLDGRGAPENVTLPKLISWAEHPEDGIRCYSGVAEYTKTFDLPAEVDSAGRIYLLDLGEVCDIAQVRVNGMPPVILWHRPFRMDVTSSLRPGRNTLVVQVANRWINRLIGDEQIPPSGYSYLETEQLYNNGSLAALPDWLDDPQKAARVRRRNSFSTWKHYSKDDSPVASGLIGPVRLTPYMVVVPSAGRPALEML